MRIDQVREYQPLSRWTIGRRKPNLALTFGPSILRDMYRCSNLTPERPRFLQLLDFALEFRFLLKTIVTGPATDDFAAFPILKDTVHVFASNSGHGREVALPDLVLNDDAVRSDISPKMIRQFEHFTNR